MTPLVHISGESRVAEKYGLEEAIFLHSLIFWYRTNRGNGQNFYDGRWWTYNSVKAYEDIFPWWNAGQIRRIIGRCKEKGALLAGDYNQDRRDRTAWYSPSDELLELYGENENCICRKQQMQMTEPSLSVDENDKCNIRKPCSNHVETNMNTPCSPPEGDAPAGKKKSGKSMPKYKPDTFEFFWGEYPKRDKRQEAIKAWDKLKPDKELCHIMLAAIKRACSSPQWTKDGGQFIPLFSTWLNQRQWTNEGVDLSLLSQPQDAGSGWADAPGVGP